MATVGVRLLPSEETTPRLETGGRRHGWPDAVAYREAIQHPSAHITDRFLSGATVALDRRGLPLAYTGRFAVVFRVTLPDDSLWALRCYTSPPQGLLDERAERYACLESALQADGIRGLFAPFRYIPDGIQVGGQRYPALAMPWIPGETLGRFVEKNREDPAALLTLARTMGEVLRRLQTVGVAHGDWQHDNILVSEGGRRITFVDYDGVYAHSLAQCPPTEQGHPNYQHPSRTGTLGYGPDIDRFPCHLIQTALTALAVEPSLWDSFNDGESLVFRRVDLEDPAESTAFASVRLVSHSAPELGTLLRTLEESCKSGVAPAIADTTLFDRVAARMGVVLGHPTLEPLTTSPALNKRMAVTVAQQEVEAETEKASLTAEISAEARRWFETVKTGLKRQKAQEQIHLWGMRAFFAAILGYILLYPFPEQTLRVFISMFAIMVGTAIGYYLWPRNLEGIQIDEAMEQNIAQLEFTGSLFDDVNRRLRTINKNPANLSTIAYVAAALQSIRLDDPKVADRIGLSADDQRRLLTAGIERLSDLPADLPIPLSEATRNRLYQFKQAMMDTAREAYEGLSLERRAIQLERDRLEAERMGLTDTDNQLRRRASQIGSGSFGRFLWRVLSG